MFTLYVEENFHFMDEGERYTLGVFDSEEEAVRAAKGIVDQFLLGAYQPGQNADDLFAAYHSFGEDPWISASEFSAWDYARKRCTEICA